MKVTHDVIVKTAGPTIGIDTCVSASQEMSTKSAEELIGEKLESLGRMTPNAPLTQLSEPLVGPECFAVPMSNYLAMVERDNKALEIRAREMERERDVLEMKARMLEARVRELEKREGFYGEGGYQCIWSEKRRGKQIDIVVEDEQVSGLQEAQDINRNDELRGSQSLEVELAPPPNATPDQCDCGICKRRERLQIEHASSSKVLLEDLDGWIPRPWDIEEDIKEDIKDVDENIEMIELESTEINPSGSVLGLEMRDSGMNVDEMNLPYDGRQPTVRESAPTFISQLGVFEILSLTAFPGSPTQLLASTESRADTRTPMDLTQDPASVTSRTSASDDCNIEPSPAARDEPNNTTLSSSISRPNVDSDFVDPESVKDEDEWSEELFDICAELDEKGRTRRRWHKRLHELHTAKAERKSQRYRRR